MSIDHGEQCRTPDGRFAAPNPEVAALRRELDLLWQGHNREHTQHEAAHAREHAFTQQAIDVAAVLAKENKADANEWRESMNDREMKFANVAAVEAINARLRLLDEARIVTVERERQRVEEENDRRTELDHRISRQQWTVGIVMAGAAIFVNVLIRLATT